MIGQLIFIAVWIGFNSSRPDLAWDNKSFDILRLILTIEASLTGSILLMTQHRQSQKDRAIIYNDYIIDCSIYKDVKEIRKQLDKMKSEAGKETKR